MKKINVIISGGGTGGHIFPAISIANEIKERYPNANILFVGAEDKMEMEKVPTAGYPIKGLPIAGFQRRFTFKNFTFFFKLFRSLYKSKKIVRTFQPDIAIGTGGFASGPLLKMAANKGIPILLQEQNSYAGVTNKLLAKEARYICVAYDNMERFFDKSKIVLTGNPVRQDICKLSPKNEQALQHFKLDSNKKCILIIGGSLGAKTLNDAIKTNWKELIESEIQILWQTGSYYYDEIVSQYHETPNIHIMKFISRMDYAYSAADLVISRAGASSISELAVAKKASILIPSPNVAENHQMHNALALANKKAALLIEDDKAIEEMVASALKTVHNNKQLRELEDNIEKLAKPFAVKEIVDKVEEIILK